MRVPTTLTKHEPGPGEEKLAVAAARHHVVHGSWVG